VSTSHRLGPLVLIATITCSCGGTPPTSPSASTNIGEATPIQGRVQDSVLRPVVYARVTIVDGPLAGLDAKSRQVGRRRERHEREASDVVTLHERVDRC
jgi:hypothetical protein